MRKESCYTCKFYIKRQCSKWHGNEQAHHHPHTTSCTAWEQAWFRPTNKSRLESLAEVAVFTLAAMCCLAKGFKAALLHHRVLFIVGAVIFAFISGALMPRKSK